MQFNKAAVLFTVALFIKNSIILKRNFKFSVSWFISYAINKFLDEIVKEMINPENQRNTVDNYDQNFIHIAKMSGELRVFITIWGVPEEK